jgi:hypothetical protein
MGMAPDARIYYGYDLGSEFTIYHREAETFDERYEDLTPDWWRVEEPDEHLAKALGWDGVEPMYAFQFLRDKEEALPVELGSYGALYDGDTGRCLQVKASVIKGEDWGDVEFDPERVRCAAGWDRELAGFVKLMDLKLPRGAKPGWHLCCSYG